MKSHLSFRMALFGAACAMTLAILLGLDRIADQAPAAAPHAAQIG